jgi:hypothetical protein
MKQVNRTQLEQVSGGCFGRKNQPTQSTTRQTAYQPPVSSASSRPPSRVGV